MGAGPAAVGAGLVGTAHPPWRLQEEHLGQVVVAGGHAGALFYGALRCGGAASCPLPTSPAGGHGARRPAPKSSLRQSVGWVTSLQGPPLFGPQFPLQKTERVGILFLLRQAVDVKTEEENGETTLSVNQYLPLAAFCALALTWGPALSSAWAAAYEVEVTELPRLRSDPLEAPSPWTVGSPKAGTMLGLAPSWLLAWNLL